MGRNYIIFLVSLVILLVFSIAFALAGIYAEQLVAAVFALVGFVATLAFSLAIGLAAREEYGMLGLWFFIVAGVTSIVFVWFLTRGGVLLAIW